MFQKVFDDTTNFEIYAFVLDIIQGIAEQTVERKSPFLQYKT